MLQLDGTAMPILGGSDNDGISAGLGGAVGAVIGSAIGGNGLFGNNNHGYNNNGWSDAAKTDIALNPAFQSLQNQITNLSTTISTNSLQDSIHDVSDEILSATGTLQTNIATGNFTTLNSINGLGRDVTTQANQNALQQLNSFNQLTTTVLQGQNNLAMQTQNSTNQIISQGTFNAAANAAGFCGISKELATCCCEIKQKITDDGNVTRTLINDLNVSNLRDKLAAANNKISNNEQNQYLVSTLQRCCPCSNPCSTPVVV